MEADDDLVAPPPLPTNKSKAGFGGCWLLTPGRDTLRPGREEAAAPLKADGTEEWPGVGFESDAAMEASVAAAP